MKPCQKHVVKHLRFKISPGWISVTLLKSIFVPWGVRGCRDGGHCTGVGAVKRPRPQVPEDTVLLVTMWPLITCRHADRMLLAPNQFWVNSFYDKIPIHGAALFTTYCALYHESDILCLSLTVFNGRDNSTTKLHSSILYHTCCTISQRSFLPPL